MRCFSIVGLCFLVIGFGGACGAKKSARMSERYHGGEIHFGFDSDGLGATGRDVVVDAASYLASHSEAIVVLKGHTDAAGSARYNLDLGDRRARTVKAALMAAGIAADRIITVSYGEERVRKGWFPRRVSVVDVRL